MATWRATGETEGLLTLPPDQPSIRIGDVEIHLADPGQASGWGYPVAIGPVRGAKLEGWRQGPVALRLETTVEGETQEAAADSAYAAMERALDLMLLSSGGAIAPVRVTRVIEQGWILGHKRMLGAVEFAAADVLVWSPEHADRLAASVGVVERLSGGDRERLRVALRWFRRASVHPDVGVQYLFLWFAVESVSQMEFLRPKPEPVRCRKCGKRLKCKACGTAPEPRPPTRVRELLVGATGLWSAAEYRDRYGLRSRLAHGGIGLTPTEEDRVRALIEPMRDAVRGVLNYTLNLEPRADARSGEG